MDVVLVLAFHDHTVQLCPILHWNCQQCCELSRRSVANGFDGSGSVHTLQFNFSFAATQSKLWTVRADLCEIIIIIIIIIITQLLTRHMSVIKTNRRRGRCSICSSTKNFTLQCWHSTSRISQKELRKLYPLIQPCLKIAWRSSSDLMVLYTLVHVVVIVVVVLPTCSCALSLAGNRPIHCRKAMMSAGSALMISSWDRNGFPRVPLRSWLNAGHLPRRWSLPSSSIVHCTFRHLVVRSSSYRLSVVHNALF